MEAFECCCGSGKTTVRSESAFHSRASRSSFGLSHKNSPHWRRYDAEAASLRRWVHREFCRLVIRSIPISPLCLSSL